MNTLEKLLEHQIDDLICLWPDLELNTTSIVLENAFLFIFLWPQALSRYSTKHVGANSIKLAPFQNGPKGLAHLGSFCWLFPSWQLKPV